MALKRGKATPSPTGVVRGQRATNKRRQTTTVPPTPNLRRSLRSQASAKKTSARGGPIPQEIPPDVPAPSARKWQKTGPQIRVLYYLLRRAVTTPYVRENSDADFVPSNLDDLDDGSTTSTPSRESTPLCNIDNSMSRPGHQRLIDRSPLGYVCTASLRHNANGEVQDSHILDRCCAGNRKLIKGFETVMVYEPGTFNVDSPSNRVFLASNYHIMMDKGKWAYIPKAADLERLLAALKKEQLGPIEGQQAPPPRGPNGFTHHKDVFPNDIRGYHIGPFSTWDDPALEFSRKREVYSTEPSLEFRPPWNTPLPIVELPCSPYFVAWKAYKTLQNEDVHLPAHLATEEALLRKIGQLMWDYGLGVPCPS
ncbi:uncharacterized protein SCHCODRAFT_01175367 [Schizophyllum commune H4-8]|nr:uncharacterized protein SCHCODRAFT_01175367 [Schizophyllum commune H4-8]KAI5886963.1 hypothetical protein SCHCODRAFT_01175367 [Schizophyllum commune H4-8]